MFTKEWKAIFTNKKLLISIIAILFIPLMYAGMFIYAFWNPYGHLENLPVAIINNDKGAELNGEELQLGKELVENLQEENNFDYYLVDEKTGYDKLENKDYYMLIEIPANFSENATTIMDEQPKKLALNYIPNEGFNFLASQIGNSAVNEIKASLQENVTETYAETIFDNLMKMADGFQSANDASEELLNGAESLDEGTGTLKENLALLAENQVTFSEGTSTLVSGSKELASGVQSLHDGLGQLTDASSQLVDGANTAKSGATDLKDGINQVDAGLATLEDKLEAAVAGSNQLEAGSQQLADGLHQLQAGTDEASQGATEVKNGVATLQQQLAPLIASLPEENQAALNAALQQLSEGTAALEAGNQQIASSTTVLADGATDLSTNISTLSDGQIALKNGVSELHNGSSQLKTGVDQLLTGQNQLASGLQTFSNKLMEAYSGSDKLLTGAEGLTSGAEKLESGSTELADGSNKLANGATELKEGTEELTDGASEFHDQLNDAAKDSEDVNPNESTYNMFANPVDLNKDAINEVPNYGTGFTPYFLSLALFVGALTFTVIFQVRDPQGVPKTAFSWFLSKTSVFVIVGIIQALLASGLLLVVMDLQVKSVPLFIGFSIITSLTFIAIIQLLTTTMDNPGRFLAIIILILQLTGSAGTFPLELIPEPLQAINHFLPMAYSISGFKEVITNGNFSVMWSNATVLLSVMVVCFVLTAIYFVFKFKKTYKAGNVLLPEGTEES
ncbi:YhgE/Pip domain-containing protein [Caldibacillus lycopersici]|uniref:YhgE/Pip domain-containing protein n=1 Tax=Perspicuibacillus lycopersici TaxID=1325689 RepID=A0AAE3IWN2_9BACI|nr:YhgE/Pip domain-containing protein [Perspicuibacillus lycopersici]MCU9614958.1 YhgE/Pip domain-containing protein [Perspicuibacillus lycopersici]